MRRVGPSDHVLRESDAVRQAEDVAAGATAAVLAVAAFEAVREREAPVAGGFSFEAFTFSGATCFVFIIWWFEDFIVR